jgi:tRNA (guanine37-N1)-methyltransferase
MIIDIITLFPEMFKGVFSSSIVKIAQDKKKVFINIHNLRDFSEDRHKRVDSPPYGGGPGMVLQCGPLFSAGESLIKDKTRDRQKIVLLSPQGRPLTPALAETLLKNERLVLICGRYEGVDERVREGLVDQQVSIGDYVLSGGEVPAMVLVEVLVRLIPGVVGDYQSVRQESFQDNLLDYPQYTQPRVFRNRKVPQILFSGNHKAIKEWRRKQAVARTKNFRPDLLEKEKTEKHPEACKE